MSNSSVAERMVELVVQSSIQSVGEVLDFVAERGAQMGLSERQVFEVQLAVDEAVTNVITHAYEGLDGELKVRCRCQPGAFVIEVLDRGKPFDPTRLPSPDLSRSLKHRQVGGLGVHLIRKVMDDVVYRYDPSVGNILRMVKRL